VEFEGALYHVLDRGDRQEAIFGDDHDRECFLATLGKACARTGWRVHAYVLMSNHYHLLVETPQPNLVAGMRWFQTTYTVRFNRRHRVSGHLFQGRYKAVVVDPEERGYFALLSDYIHLNPVRARMIGLEQRLFDYPWSSYPFYVARKKRPPWFDADTVLGELGLRDDAAGRRAYGERMRQRAVEELRDEGGGLEREELRRGWCLGGAGFRERMLRLLEQLLEQTEIDRTRLDAILLRYNLQLPKR
jgi:REP element-mobilizing transposase RayT